MHAGESYQYYYECLERAQPGYAAREELREELKRQQREIEERQDALEAELRKIREEESWAELRRATEAATQAVERLRK